MSTGSPDDIDRAAIAEHAQRTAERAALRKVRKTLDGMQSAQVRERRVLRAALAVCGILLFAGMLAVSWLLFGAR